MSQTAAHLVDHVIPHVPMLQGVLSLPIPLRVLLAAQPGLVIRERPVIETSLTHLGLSADARPSLRTDFRPTKGPSAARAWPARLDPQPTSRGRAREAGRTDAT
jgi:hypothetical protein